MKTYNIPIFVPHRGCRFDCVFCNQRRITGEQKSVTGKDVKRIINEHLSTIEKNGNHVEAAFFGGSFTGIPIEEQSALLEAAKPFIDSGRLDGIRLSTRPDYITREILDNLYKYHVTTIELGVQSMDNEVLAAAGRGHTKEQVTEAVRLIKEYPFALGLQMMTGLPSDTEEKALKTADELIALEPSIVRIYPTLVIRDTPLEDMFFEGSYKPQSLEEAVELSKKLLLKFEEHNIRVIRIGLQSTNEIRENGSVTAGPVHSAFRELVESGIYYDIFSRDIKNARTVRAYVNPKEISKAAGNRRMNIKRLKTDKNIDLTISGDESLKGREVRYACF